MKQKAIWLAAIVGAASVPLLAQSGAKDPISLLLVEVQQLRLAIERSNAFAPQIQLLSARLTVQNDRVARATADHDATRRELEEVSASASEMQNRLQSIEMVKRDSLPQGQQRMFEEMETSLKNELPALAAREQRLRAREAELAAALSSEQSRWGELNRRLDELERELKLRP